MSLLRLVTKGKIVQPHLVVIYGKDGVGKTTFAADAPNPIFLGAEKGTSNLDVSRFTPSNYDQVLQFITDLTNDKHEYQTLAVDTLDWLEPLVFEKVIKAQNKADIKHIDDIPYGKGYGFALDFWREMIAKITELQEKTKMNVVFIAHSEAKRFSDPALQSEYDRYQLKLNAKAAALFREYVDAVLFATFEVSTRKDEQKKTRAFADGTRVIYTEMRAGWDAKNRFGLALEMPLSWEVYDEAVRGSSGKESDSAIRAEIVEMVKQVKDEKIIKKVESKLAENPSVEILSKMRNQLATMIAS